MYIFLNLKPFFLAYGTSGSCVATVSDYTESAIANYNIVYTPSSIKTGTSKFILNINKHLIFR